MSLIPTFYPQYISLPSPPHMSSPHPFVLLLVLVLVVQVFSWLGPREPKSVCWDHLFFPPAGRNSGVARWRFSGISENISSILQGTSRQKQTRHVFATFCMFQYFFPHLSRTCRRHFSQGLIHCGYLRMIKLPQGGSTSP